MAVITPQFVKENYLWGMEIYSSSGAPLPDTVLENLISAAQDRVERTLNIVIEPREFVELHDYYACDYMNWAYIDLYRRPVIAVEKVELVFGDQSAITIDPAWVRLSEGKGQMQLFPVWGKMGTMIITGSGLWLPIVFRQWQYAPKLWRITYTAGFEEVPQSLKEVIAKETCISLAEMFIDLIVGPSVGSQSINVDGVSQSTTVLADHPRIKQYREDLQRFYDQVSQSFRGIDFVVA